MDRLEDIAVVEMVLARFQQLQRSTMFCIDTPGGTIMSGGGWIARVSKMPWNVASRELDAKV